MKEKDLIKDYKDTFKKCKENPNEQNKKVYINAFNAFDTKLNKDLSEYLNKCKQKTRTLKEEASRIQKVIDSINYRKSLREKMIKDYASLMNYKPKNLPKIPLEHKLDEISSYKTNIEDLAVIIKELISSGKQIREFKDKKSVFTSDTKTIKKVDTLTKTRVKLINLLKNNPSLMDDLYLYAVRAPYSSENGYINYLLIKSDPKKILTEDNKNEQ